MGLLKRKMKKDKIGKNEAEKVLLVKQPKSIKTVSLFQLFRYGSKFDFLLMFLGASVAIFTGVGTPFLSIILGNMSQSFINMTKLMDSRADNQSSFIQQYSTEKFNDDVINKSFWSVYMGIGLLFSSLIQVTCFLVASENMMHQMRKAFFAAILRQNIEWFDLNNCGTLATKLFDNLERVKEGTGDKVALAIQYSAQFFAGFVIAFMYDVKLTLIMMCIAPFMAFSGVLLAKVMSRSIANEVNHYATAGAVAEEALTSLRTVYAFNGQKYECERYDKALIKAKNGGFKRVMFIGGTYAITHFISFASYCLAFWLGTNFVVDKSMDAQALITVFFSIMMGSTALGQAGQQFSVIGTAQGAAGAVYDIIDKKLEIDSTSDNGIKLSNIKGHITVSDVNFSYPSRPDISVLNGIGFEALPGKTVALVGSSGCGKSTIISLLLRFYNSFNGKIKLDGYDINELNLKSLRKSIGVVSQEPVLFNCSIEENIKMGNSDVSDYDMRQACKMANAEKFISNLPLGYKTLVGERGIQLSGGQKQRIAIARALIRNPKILLLDEATSALDAESEFIVQQALDRARQGRTTIIIAHRLSTIRNADKIISIKDGIVEEIGCHKELMAKEGYYYKLVNSQVFADIEGMCFFANKPYCTISAQPTMPTRDVRARTISQLSKLDPLSPMFDINEEEKTTLIKDPNTKLKKLQKALDEEGAKPRSLFAILKYAKPEAHLIIIGLIFAVIEGTIFPTFSLFFSNIMETFSGTDPEQIRQEGHFWALTFLVLGTIFMTSIFFDASLFGLMSERLTMRIRSKLFKNILRQDVAYFDQPNHSTGKLCTRLASDVPNIRMAIDCRLSAIFSSAITMCTGVFIAFYFNWQMALLVVAIFPLVGLAEKFQLTFAERKAFQDAKDMENAGKVALEAIENIRTVQALTLEDHFYNQFKNHLEFPHQTSVKKAIIQGLTYAFSTSLFFFLYAAAFRFGGWLIVKNYETSHEIMPMDILRALYAISFTAGTMGFASSFFPAYIKAKIAAGLIFKMLEDKPVVDNLSNKGIEAKNINGQLNFNNIKFAYPERKDAKVLNGINIEAKPGETIALVGSSGCGKSTIVSLLERFYEPLNGCIKIDGRSIQEYGLQDMRSQISLVSQEPILFDKSIRENIFYGLKESEKLEESMIEVTKLANIHNFIISLPEQYDTRVGEKGTQLSGGQKQRIAIARALIRNPKILLLDEATSALDTESEKLVQEALDRARKGRTCIVIAHRLSTIINADRIIVISNGNVIEIGTHLELMELKGAYFALTQKQNNNRV